MASKPLPTIPELRQLLRYDPETGSLFWLPRTGRGIRKGLVGSRALNYATTSGHLVGSACGRNLLAHRVVWALHYGEWPSKFIDHIDGNPANNKIENLRDVSAQDNQRNQKLNKRSLSGVCGVRWRKSRNKWKAEIRVDGKDISLGSYDNMEDAVTARKAAERKYGFHPNHGRRA